MIMTPAAELFGYLWSLLVEWLWHLLQSCLAIFPHYWLTKLLALCFAWKPVHNCHHCQCSYHHYEHQRPGLYYLRFTFQWSFSSSFSSSFSPSSSSSSQFKKTSLLVCDAGIPYLFSFPLHPPHSNVWQSPVCGMWEKRIIVMLHPHLTTKRWRFKRYGEHCEIKTLGSKKNRSILALHNPCSAGRAQIWEENIKWDCLVGYHLTSQSLNLHNNPLSVSIYFCFISYSFRVIILLHRCTLKTMSPSYKRNKKRKDSKKDEEKLFWLDSWQCPGLSPLWKQKSVFLLRIGPKCIVVKCSPKWH